MRGFSPHRLIAALVAVGIGFALIAAPEDSFARRKKEKVDPAQAEFDKLTADADKSEGFLTVYKTDEKIYVELPETAFEEDFCLSAQIVGAVGDWMVRGSGAGIDVIRFKKLGDNVQVSKKNIMFRADEDASIHHAVLNTFSDSPILTAKLEGKNPETGGSLADLKGLFSASTYEVLSHRTGFSTKEEGTIVAIHNNPDNLTVQVAYHFKRSPGKHEDGGGFFGGGVGRLPDSRNVGVTVQYDLFRLPENGFRPRPADDRLGVWGQVFKDYTNIDDRDRAFRYNAIRWNVEKTDPSATVSPAKEPITFYIDKAVPMDVRPLIREAVLWWNKAFEKVGISNAVVVKDQPEDADWHPTDIRYSNIYWNLSDDLMFSGLAGPSLTNPITGQVLKANAYLNAEFFSYARHRYLVYTWWRGPAVGEWEREGGSAFAGLHGRSSWWDIAAARGEGRRRRAYLCDYDASFSSQLAFARLLLQSRGLLPPGSLEEDRYAREAFHELVAHEIGHTLGFGHNFKASLLSKYDDILSGAAGGAISGSIMDYNPINLPLPGNTPGPFFLTELGEYDHFAVEYLYQPFDDLTPEEERKRLQAIAARAETSPGLAFDDGTLSGSDPTSSTDDLGDDPLRFASDRLAMVAEILPRIPELVLAEGHEYNLIRQALDAAIFSVSMDYFDLTSRYIGGREILRIHHQTSAHSEAPSEQTPITPISAETQFRALDLITNRLFADDAYLVDAEFLNQISADLLFDWNYPQHYAKDYNYEARISWMYGTTLATVLEPGRLARVKDNEGRFGDGETIFILPDLFDRLTAGVFKGLEQGNISASAALPALAASKRRALHRIYVNLLADMVLSPANGTPADASVLASAELKKITARARRAAGTVGLDRYGKAHLADLQTRIGRVLDAKIGIVAGER